MEKKKKKLTLSNLKIRPADKVSYARGQNRTSVVVEKKINRQKQKQVSNFVDKEFQKKNITSQQSNYTKNEFSQKKPFFSKNSETRRLAEQQATRRIKEQNFNLAKTKLKTKTKIKIQDKTKIFPQKREYKLTISRALNEDEPGFKERSLASVRRARLKEKKFLEKEKIQTQNKQVVQQVHIPEQITIQELSNRMAEQASRVIKHLLGMGVTATINHTIDADTAEYLVKEFGHKAIREKNPDLIHEKLNNSDPKLLKLRPPIITVMGHVDHGKTSLLDAMRKTNVVSKEHGGITQHIGAYQVTMNDGKSITFIDTPGHAAFTEMRARGSKVTDIVVLVVAADDGVKPQTVEAIKHAKAAKVPIIVAINKSDLPEADPQKIKNQLLEYELVAEELSGDTLFVEVSAKTRKNLDKLVESIFLQSELLDLKANFNDKASGVVLESKVDKGRGPVSSIIITGGSLNKGDFFVCGSSWGKVRAMINHQGKNVDIAGPSVPVEILGMNNSANSGDNFVVVESEARAKEVNSYRIENTKSKKSPLISTNREFVFDNFKKTKELQIIIKSDVHGSTEALKNAINAIKHEEVVPKIVLSDIGLISETDVSLAKASGAIILGFGVKASKEAKKLSENYKIDIKYFNVIYEALEFVNSTLSGMLKPDIKEQIIGSAEILEIFKVSKVGKVAGSKVIEGEITNSSKARLIRDGNVLYTGAISSIFREKNAARQVSAGLECGITLKDFADFKEKDVIEAYNVTESARTI